MTAKREIRVALAGNPNSGKSSIFNALTGAHQHVGNWPGVTVERREGRSTYQGHAVTVVDLPGTYTLDAYTLDEKIASDFLVKERPDGVVAVVDAANLERNLYLVAQLLEMGARVIVALNMVDIAESRGMEIDRAGLEQALGVKVVPTVALRGEGIEELRRAIHDIGRAGGAATFRIPYGPEIEAAVARLCRAIKDATAQPDVDCRWRALKLLEGGSAGTAGLAGDVAAVRAELAAVKLEIERRLGIDAETAVVERRYGFLNGVVKECVRRRPGVAGRIDMSEAIDRVVMNRWLGIPLFLVMMWATFQLVFTVGTPVSDLIDRGFGLLAAGLKAGLLGAGMPAWLGSLFGDGLIGGVGSVLVFLPNILILFLIISLLEDSGYMARAAFVMDRFMHLMGLHGKSFVPMIVGFGCNVPAILATRILESRKDRVLTVLVNPLMSCSARLPIYILFTGAFFTRQRGLVVFSLYLLGIVLAVLVARLFKWLFFKEEVAPLIMELPPYHLPSLRSVLNHAWERVWLFVRKAGTVIAVAVMIVWLLASLPWGVGYASEHSFIGRIGGFFAPLLAPAGFGKWWAAAALLAGVVAKEVVVGTMATIRGVGTEELVGVIRQEFTPASAYAFMVMSLLYLPCVSAVAAIRRELGWRWALLVVGYTMVLGWVMAVLVYRLGTVVA